MSKEQMILADLKKKFNTELTIEEDTTPNKPVFFIYGDKGVGKTTLAFTFPGTLAVISFDNQSKRIKDIFTRFDPTTKDRIHVYNGVKYYTYNVETATASGYLSLQYIKTILNSITADWIIFDGTEILLKLCELSMRYINNIPLLSGVEWQYWNYRNYYIREIHNLALKHARVGVIYVDWQVTIDDDTIAEKTIQKAMPKWASDIKHDTEFVIYVDRVIHKSLKSPVSTTVTYIATVESSKDERILISGQSIDITNYKPIITAETVKNVYGIDVIPYNCPCMQSTNSEIKQENTSEFSI
jgi:hypothetical protein